MVERGGPNPNILQPNPERQGKIIHFLAALSQNIPIDKAATTLMTSTPVTPQERSTVLSGIAGGTITPRMGDALLTIVQANDPTTIAPQVENTPALRHLTYTLTEHMPKQGTSAQARLAELFRQNPLPQTAESQAKRYITRLTDTRPELAQQLTTALPTFLHKVYGHRYEYWQELQLVVAEAQLLRPQMAPTQIRERLQPHAPEVHPISEAKASEVLGQTQIHGDPFGIQQRRLTTETLRQEHLQPHYVTVIDGKKVYFSDSYQTDHAPRLAIVGYMPDDMKPDTYIARTFYTSYSHGVVKSLPAYEREADRAYWFYKGHMEPSITLPSEMQYAISQVLSATPPVTISEQNRELVFAGTARDLDNVRKTTYVSVVNRKSIDLGVQYFDKQNGALLPPEKIVFAETDMPNFDTVIMTWQQPTIILGELTMEVFMSKDGKKRWLFARDTQGRTAPLAIEDPHSSITSTGLKPEWFNMSLPPLDEHTRIAGAYGGNNNPIRPGYVDMYAKYLSRVPVVKAYLASVAART